MNYIGEKIAQLRKEKNYTQEQLAEKMGVTPQSVSKWEKGLTCPDISALPLLSQIFGVSVDELLGNVTESQQSQVNRLTNKELKNLMFKVLVTSAGGDNVKVQLPYPVIKTLISTGMKIPSVSAKLNDVNFDEVFACVESGMLGEIVTVNSKDGDTVRIVVE